MGFFSKLKGLFSRSQAPSGERKGFFERRREKKRQREYERSQKRQEKMDKERQAQEAKEKRKREEEQKKREAEQKERERDQKARNKFKERWGMNDQEYDNFTQFISAVPGELKEVFGSETLLEAFRTANSYNISGSDLNMILKQTYNNAAPGSDVEDVINDLFINIQGYAENVKSGAFI